MFSKSLTLALGTVSTLALGTAAFAQSDDASQNEDGTVLLQEGEAEQSGEQDTQTDGEAAESGEQDAQTTPET